MRKALEVLLFILLCAEVSSQHRIPGQIIVQLNRSVTANELVKNFAPPHPEMRMLSKSWNIWLLTFHDGKEEKQLKLLRAHPSVRLAQFNHSVSPRSITPNDTLFPEQWNLENTGQFSGTPGADISATEAWQHGTGGITATGDTIVLAIVDEGAYLLHQDLRFWKNRLDPHNGLDDDFNGYIDDYNGWDVKTHSDSIPNDFHGTHVAGIAAATGNNITGVAGVAWDAMIMPVSIPDYEEAQVVEAYSYIFDMRKLYNVTSGRMGAFIVAANSSFGIDFGMPDDYPLWCAMYDSLGSVGVLSVASTANITTDVDIAGDIPSLCPSEHLIVVTSTTRFDTRANGTAIGAVSVDLGAPGSGIYSTTLFDNYAPSSGTSMAAAHVTGAVALIYSAACRSFLQNYMDNPDSLARLVKNFILSGTDSLSELTGLTVTGGRLNVYKSMMLVNDFCISGLNHPERGSSLFAIYPNPAESVAHLKLLSGENSFVELIVTDISGKPVLKNTYSYPPETISINLTNSGKGIFIIKLSTPHQTQVQKIISL